MQPVDFRKLANTFVSELTPYQPGKPIEELERELGITSSIKLASNENPLGASLLALEAAENALKYAHIYPDGSCFEIKDNLSKFLSVSMNQLTIGNGSENILEMIVKSYLHSGDHAVISQYAFLTIPILIKSYGGIAKIVNAKNWGHDIPEMIKAIDEKTRIIFVVNPNNPTGTYSNQNDFALLMSQVPGNVVVVIDEAYSEYISATDYPNAIEYLSTYPNLIICRTFSKVYGLAAFRLGYAISSPEIADILNRSRLPFNVNTIANKAGCAALADQAHVKKSVTLNNHGMDYLIKQLQSLHYEFIPSLGNFVTIKVGDGSITYQKLLQQGVIVRPLNAYGMPQHIRVTIGTHEQNERFISTLKLIR
jgi:histidinol-phosphate aminotransferase